MEISQDKYFSIISFFAPIDRRGEPDRRWGFRFITQSGNLAISNDNWDHPNGKDRPMFSINYWDNKKEEIWWIYPSVK
jgi:hypothetical protein